MEKQYDERILAVDDEKSVCEVLRSVLSRRGYNVKSVTTGPLALTEIPTYRPHLVLLDLRMPGMDGFETLRRIKQLWNDLPVIVLTGVTDTETARRAMEQGAVDYIAKPFDNEQLLTNVRVHCLMNISGDLAD
jgi:DNA-binding response OmpR family regulator